jgi:hypothetical protein
MSVTIIRTADRWWADKPTGASPINTSARTTGELLADRDAITSAVEAEGEARPATPLQARSPRPAASSPR